MGHQEGSVYPADQNLPITYTRVRDLPRRQEVPLQTYERLRAPRAADAGLFGKVLRGLSYRDYVACAEAVLEAFRLGASSVSRRFIRASARHLQTLCEWRLDGQTFVSLISDRKTSADGSPVIAVGITTLGEKKILDFVQTATENESVCAAFLRGLVGRGL